VTASPAATHADRLLHAALYRLLVLARVCTAADERLPQEARHLVVRERPGGLERCRAEHGEVERGVALRVAVERARERSGGCEPTGEDAHDRGVRLVGRPFHAR
jgi:hypothetical protein